MENKQAYEQKAQAKLDQLNGEIQVLKAKKDNAKADAKIEYEQKIDELHKLEDEIANKLDEIKNTSSDAWEELKDGFEKSSTTMENAIKSAFSKFS